MTKQLFDIYTFMMEIINSRREEKANLKFFKQNKIFLFYLFISLHSNKEENLCVKENSLQ